jgi:hypothetical protein
LNRRLCDGLASAAALAALAVCARSALVVLGYPWDWAPDEGLALDYARRVVEAPRTLYGRELIPFPAAYTPLLPLLLAPLVRISEEPLLGARVLALVWTAAAALSLFLLARRRSAALGLVAAALALAPRDFSVWLVLVRVDGLMLALWLGAAVVLLPARLQPGADTLSRARLLAGAGLLLAAVLVKPTAIVHGAPLVLGWFLVHRGSAWRLTAAMAAGGLAALAALQAATDGGFLWTMRLWGVHPRHEGLLERLAAAFVVDHAALLVLAAVAVAVAWKRREGPLRDSAWLLVLGGLAVVPALGKAGAWTNYLLPLYCALVAVACRLWPVAPPAAVLVPAALGLALLARPHPLPTPGDAATSSAFYSFVRDRGRPLLATRPDYAYFLLRQPVEAEGSSLPHLVAAGVPGTGELLERVRRRHYRLIVAQPYFWPNDRAFEAALAGGYEIAGTCELAFFYGRSEFVLLPRRGDGAVFAPPAGTRCRALAAPAP